MFLNGLITNDMKTLTSNSWMPAAFINVQGRLLAAVRVIHRRDGFLIDTEAPTREAVIKLLARFTLAGDFQVTDLTDEANTISVQGRRAAEVIASVVGQEASQVSRQQVISATFADDRDVNVIRATHTGEDGFDLFVDAATAAPLRSALIEAGAQAVSGEVAETLRIEAGIPRYGLDMDESTVIPETNLEDAISYTKGCYVGQEIVVRIKHRGHVAKRLTGVVFESEHNAAKDAKIFSVDDQEIGRVTSATFSPRLNKSIALAYLKYSYLANGTVVGLSSDTPNVPASVVELPFVRGSW